MYSSRMVSSPEAVLGSLPHVFDTAAYQREAGVAPSSASRALRALADRDLVTKLQRATWRNLMVPAPIQSDFLVEQGAVRGMWNPEVEALLEATYGDAPRRISGMAALLAAGVPLMCDFEIAVEHGTRAGAGLGFAVRGENSETLLLHAEQVTANTWISNPPRAVLECAQHPVRYDRWEERLGWMMVSGFDVCSPEDVLAVSADFGWRAGLRRLSSIAEALAGSPIGMTFEFSPDPGWAALATTASQGDVWLELAPFSNTPTQPAWIDTARKVAWSSTPNGLAAEVTA